MRRSFSAGLFIGIALFAAGALISPAVAGLDRDAGRIGQKTEAADLRGPLAQAAHYCRRLEASVLDFICREEVVETVDASRDRKQPSAVQHDWSWMQGRSGVTSYSYMRKSKIASLYDYQCIRKENILKETRTLLKLNGKPLQEKVDQVVTTSIAYHNALLGPVNLFAEAFQPLYDFRPAGFETIDKHRAVVVEAAPKPGGAAPLCLTGKAWIDRQNGEILKIEWTQKPKERLDIFEGREKHIGGKLRLTLRTEFKAEKNGLRFPSRLWIEEAYINPRGRVFVRSRTEVEYTGFKFFTVETTYQ